jgi:hypothetical protein
MKRKQGIHDQVLVINTSEFHPTIIMRTVSFGSFLEAKKCVKVDCSLHLVLPYTMPNERYLIWSRVDNETKDSALKKEFQCFLFNPINWLIEYGYTDCFLEYILGNSMQIREEDIADNYTESQHSPKSVTWKISRGNVVRYNMNQPVYYIKFKSKTFDLEIKSLLA